VSDSVQETKIIFCNICKVATNHFLRARYARPLFNFEEGYVSENYENRAFIWSCAGCDEVTFEWQRLELNAGEEEWGDYYPTRSEDSIQAKLFMKLGPELKQLYGEVVACFNDYRLLLCTVGLRALIEGVCRDRGLTEKNLEHRIDGLVKFLPSLNVIEALHAFRFAGNDAAHELVPMSRADAGAAIRVMEDLLNFLYDLDYRASQIKNTSKNVSFGSTKPGPVH
jgi:Domain of unknown function (DUF4145)